MRPARAALLQRRAGFFDSSSVGNQLLTMNMDIFGRSFLFGGAALRFVRYAIAALAFMAASSVLAGPRPVTVRSTRPPLVAVLKPEQVLRPPLRPSMPLLDNWLRAGDALRGRTLAVASAADIVLKPHEVILSFDDGPTTGRTEGVLKILDQFGVKAIFMMVGKMAELHPESARAVALDGQTIGTHTYDHPDLTKLAPTAAFEEIRHGQQAVAAVLAPIGMAPGPFFRFPYLASTWLLQAALYADNTVVMPVNIDSDDYMRDSPKTMLHHLLARLDHEGKGVVLFHDIHPKTLIILPQFLEALAERGYTVVQLVARTPGVFTQPAVTASVP
jgi:peptidoglycan-N-acetylglucosamine deacetylase